MNQVRGTQNIESVLRKLKIQVSKNPWSDS